MAEQKMILELTEEEFEALQANIPVKTDEDWDEYLAEFTTVSFEEALTFDEEQMRKKLTPAEEMKVRIHQLKRSLDMSDENERKKLMEIVNAVSFNKTFNTPDSIILEYLEEQRVDNLNKKTKD